MKASIAPDSSILSRGGRAALRAMLTTETDNTKIAADLLLEALGHLIDHGSIEMGTPESRKLRDVLSLLKGEPEKMAQYHVTMKKDGHATTAYLCTWEQNGDEMRHVFSPSKDRALAFDGGEAIAIVSRLRTMQSDKSIRYATTAAV